MSLFRWPGHDLRHGRLQLALTAAAIAVAVALPVILVSVGGGVAAHEIAELEQSGYAISVSAAADHGITGAHNLSDAIARIAGVEAASPVLSVGLYVFGTAATPVQATAEGVIPGRFTATLGPSESGLFPDPLPLGDPTDAIHFANGTYRGAASLDVLLATPLAAAMGARSGSTVDLSALDNRSRGTAYTVTGTFGVPPALLGPSAAFAVVLPLSDLQVLTGYARTSGGGPWDAADTIQVALANGGDDQPAALNRVAGAIQALVPYYGVTTQLQEAQQLEGTDAVLTVFYLALSSVGLSVGLMFLALVLVRRVESGRRSLGIRRAIGLPPRMIAGGIVVEGLALAASGVGLGVLAGIAVISALARWSSGGVQQAASLAEYDPYLLSAIAAGILALAALASGVAVRAALRLDLSEALR